MKYLNIGSIWKHYKHSKETPMIYRVENIALHTEDENYVVVYSSIFDERKTYARPLQMFLSKVEPGKSRFEKVSEGVFTSLYEKEYSQIEAMTIIFALNVYARIYSGQLDWMTNYFDFKGNEKEVMELCCAIRNKYVKGLENLGAYASHGVYSDELDKKVEIAYNTKVEFNYALSDLFEGGSRIGEDYRAMLFVNYGEENFHPIRRAKCFIKNNEVVLKAVLDEEQLQIIEDALCVYEAAKKRDVKTLFSYFVKEDLDEIKKLDEILNENS